MNEFGEETVENCMAMTRSQGKRKQEEEAELREKEMEGGAVAKPVNEEPIEGEVGGLEEIDDDMFGEPGRARKTRWQKRREKETWQRKSNVPKRRELPSGKEELEKLQSEDKTLLKIRNQADGTMENSPGVQYVRKDGLIY